MKCRSAGFTLLEIAVVVGIIAILAAAALLGYQHYVNKAASAELIEQYGELRERDELAVGEGVNLCNDPEKELTDGALYNPHAELNIVRADPDIIGLQVKADIPSEGAHNTEIVREAFNILKQNGRLVPGHVATDTVVSFTAVLVNTACAELQAASGSPAAQAVTQQLTQALTQVTTAEDAIAQAAALAESVPESERTAVIPGPNAHALRKIGCDVTRLIKPGQPCQDMIMGDCKATYGDVLTTECVPAQVCPKSAGVCTSVSPEMKAALDQSIIRLREEMRARGEDPDALGIGVY